MGTSHPYSAAKAIAWVAPCTPGRAVGRPLAVNDSENEAQARARDAIVIVIERAAGVATLEDAGQVDRQPVGRLPCKRCLCGAQRVLARRLRERSGIEARVVVTFVGYFECKRFP